VKLTPNGQSNAIKIYSESFWSIINLQLLVDAITWTWNKSYSNQK